MQHAPDPAASIGSSTQHRGELDYWGDFYFKNLLLNEQKEGFSSLRKKPYISLRRFVEKKKMRLIAVFQLHVLMKLTVLTDQRPRRCLNAIQTSE